MANIDAETANLAATYLTATLNVLASFKNIGQNIGDWFSSLSSLDTAFPVGVASATDEVTFNPEWNGLEVSATQEVTYGNDQLDTINTTLSTGLDTLNTTVSNISQNLPGNTSTIYITQNINAPVVDSYVIRNATTMAVSSAQAGSWKLRA